MKIEEMRQLKREWGYTNEQISEQTGIAVGTVQKIFSGETKSPRRDTIVALEKLFKSSHHSEYPGPVYDFPQSGRPVLVKEGSLAETYDSFASQSGGKNRRIYESTEQGEYTAEDYNNWPESSRIELIDGVIYNLATPKATHQIIVDEIITELKNFVRSSKRNCLPLASNISVHIDNDLKTVFQPDLTILCDTRQIHRDDEHIWGAPDLVMEVLSPSTRRKDMTIKLQKYSNAGVREYWLIDSTKRQIIVYDFSNEDLLHIYSFEDKVPIGIWNGECEIDFSSISEIIERVYSDIS